MGRQQSGAGAPISELGDACEDISIAQHGLPGMQQRGIIGRPVVKTKIATAREQADRSPVGGRLSLVEDMP